MICGKVAIMWVESGGVIEAVTLALNPKNAFCPLLAFSEADQNSYTGLQGLWSEEEKFQDHQRLRSKFKQ